MTQTVKVDTVQDVVDFLKAQHQKIKELFGEVTSSTGSQREQAFFELRRMLAVHETAEEEIVHPTAKDEIPNGEAIVGARLKEERAAKEVLGELEKLDVDSTDFETKFRSFQNDVLAHAESEEQKEFSRLAERLDDDRLNRMRQAVEFAESIAPTRPHAGVESPMANVLAGPFAAMLDRARDAIAKPR